MREAGQQTTSREEAEIRKLDAETAEIEARTRERHLRTLFIGACIVAVVLHVLGVVPAEPLHGGQLIDRLVP